MRVIAGKAKGRRLRSVPGPGTRPITDRAKTALFSILSKDIVGARFLDLFAGTGQVGIEALSRGASEAVFVEMGHAAIRTIYANLTLTDLKHNAVVVRSDAFKYVVGPPPEAFDYIYIAPPQYRGMWIQMLQTLDIQMDWLSQRGWAIAQINPVEYEPLALENLVLFDQREYGGVMLCFYCNRS